MNMLKRFLSLALAIVMVLSCVPSVAFAEGQATSAAMIGSTGYDTLEAALNAAVAGDVIEITEAGDYSLVCSSYSENRYWLKDDLTIKGVDGVVVTNGPKVSAKNLTIENVDFINSSNVGLVFYLSGDSKLTGCHVEGPNGNYYSTASGTLAIDDCTFIGTATYGLHIAEGNAVVTVTDSTIAGWNTYGSEISASFENCNFIDGYGYNYVGFYKDASFKDCTFDPGACVFSQVEGITLQLDNCTVSNGAAVDTIVDADSIPTNKIYVDGRLLGAVAAVAVVEDAEGNQTEYETLAEAVAAATEDATITLLDNIELSETVTVAAGQEITLDLNGYTITGTPTEAAAYSVIINKGKLTITDSGENGAIVCNHTLVGSTAYAVNTITNSGELTVNGGALSNTSTSTNQIGYVIDNNSTSTAAILTVNGGSISASGSYYYDGVRQFCNNVTVENSVTVNGGSVSSIWLQNPSDGSDNRNSKAVSGSVTVTGGEVANLYLEPSEGFTASITGGTVNAIGEFDVEEDDAQYIPTGFITGGSFGQVVAEKYCADGVVPVTEPNAEGLYTVNTTLPTATVTEIENDELTFAMNFLVDEPAEAQFNYYKDWYADFELTVNKDVSFNADGGADGYLSGQYDEWSENWVNVPFGNYAPVEVKVGETMKIMEFAAKMLGEENLKVTYETVCTGVQDFDCGVFFTPEFLAANPDLEVTLELRMYNPADETESYVIGETYNFTPADLEAPDLPTATITETANPDLTFAMNFKADQITDKQLSYYGDWYADFELTFNKAVVLNNDGSADGWLAGQYDAWSENWVTVPFGNYAPVSLQAGETVKIMAFAAELMGEQGLKYTYKEVYEGVKDFDCGVYLDPEFLAANPDLEVTLELRMYNPADETESYVIGDTYVFTLPELPTATITEIANPDLTFAMNFKADEITERQLNYYGDWYADFELTFNKAVVLNNDGSADGWLAGQYDAWSENWVTVPFGNYAPVSLQAGETVKIMAFAAELMGEQGLKYTYKEVYEGVKDFDCGVYLDPEFLAANPDLEVTLELRMYNPEDETESYVIGDTYVFTIPTLPTATITEIANPDLTFAMNFKADQITERQLNYYGSWYADFELTVNKDVVLNNDGSADGWLAGQYDAWSENWVTVPFGKYAPVTLKAGETLKVMAFAAELMGEQGLKYTYKEVYEGVKDFDCGMFFDNAFIMANPDLEVTLELRMYNPKDESVSYVIGDTYEFTLPEYVAYNETTDTLYTTLADAIAAAQAGDKINLLKDVTIDEQIDVNTAVTVDLGGFKVTATSQKAFAVYADATFQNGAIEAVQRAIDTRTAVELNLTDLELTATSMKYSNPQPLTIGGSDNGTVVNMNNVTIEAGINGYSIITFVQTKLNIENSELNGFSNIYVKDGSAGTQITLTNTALTSVTDDPLGAFASIVTEANDITVTADEASTLTADDGAFGFTADRSGVAITFAGDIAAHEIVMGWNENLTIIVPEELTAQIEGEGLATEETATEGLVLIVLPTYVAEVNGTKYTTLQAAVDAAGNTAATVTVLKDFEQTETVVIGADQNITLNLDGKTITGLDTVTSGNFNLIVNKGNLTVTGDGTIQLTAQTNRAYNSSSSVISNQGGELVIESGHILHNGGSDMAYGIDNNSTTGATTVTVTGGTVESPYRAIRAFQNNKTEMNTINIEGGTIIGRAAIWMHQAGVNSLGELNISGGTIDSYSNAVVVDIHSGAQSVINITGGTFTNENPNANLLLIWPFSDMSTVTSENVAQFNISGGDFTCVTEGNLFGLLYGADETGEFVVSGGYFSEKVLDEYCAEGYVPTDADENGKYTVIPGEYVARNTTTDKKYTTISGAMVEAQEGETVEVLKDYSERMITILEGTTLNLNGYTVTSTYVSCYGDLVDYTGDNSSLLIVDKARFFIREDNAQLPVKDDNGYRFVELIKFNSAMMTTTKYAFQPLFETQAHELLLDGTTATGVSIRVFVSWKQGEDVRTQEFVYSDELLAGFIDSYNSETLKYDMMFTLTLKDAEEFEDLTFTAAVVSETKVTFTA